MSTYTEQDCLNKITEIDASRDECIRVLNEKNLEVPDNTKLADLPDYIHNIVEGNFTTLTTTAKFTYGEEKAFTCPDNSDGYTTATITIDFTKHNDCKYVFCGCRPQQIYSLQGKQDTSSADNLTRQVTFIFDFMFIHSDLTVSEKWYDKLLFNTAKPIINSAAHILNL